MAPARKAPPRPPSGHVFRIDRKRGPQWYAKYRVPDGRQIQRKLGPAWTERGRPGAGYFTKRTAEAWLRDVLDEARRGTLPGLVKTDVTFAEAADEWLRYVEHDRGRKPSTIAGYRALLNSQLLPVFGEKPIESITTAEIEAWIGSVDRSPATQDQGARPHARHLQASEEGLRAAAEPGGRSREAADRAERRHRRLLRGGDYGVGPGSRIRAGCRDLPDRCLHRPAPRRASRPALARRGLRGPGHPRARELRGRRADDAEVRQGPLGPDGARRGRSPGEARSARELDQRRRSRLRRARRRLPRRPSPTPPLRRRAQASQPPQAPLPRPAPHLRHPHDRQGRHPPSPRVDGPRRHPDDDEVPPLRPREGDAALVAEAFEPEFSRKDRLLSSDASRRSQ